MKLRQIKLQPSDTEIFTNFMPGLLEHYCWTHVFIPVSWLIGEIRGLMRP